jgi:hypothetical protein
MKTRNLFILSFAAMTMFAPNLSAQGWFDKALKKFDKALGAVNEGLNSVDEALGNPTEQASTTVGYETAKIKSFSANVDFIIESCINDGKMLILNFVFNNRGQDLQIGCWGCSKNVLTNVDTKFYDDLGNAYQFAYISAGTAWQPNNTGGAYFALPEGVKVRGSIGISKFDRKAKSLKSATVAGYILDERKTESTGKYTPFAVSLRDVPVYTPEQILGKDKILFQKQQPAVEGEKRSDCTVKSVIVTEKNTQVNFTFHSGMYIYVSSFNNTWISVGGSKYQLTAAYGIANRQEECQFYAGGSQQDFTLVFDKIPETTEILDVLFDGWKWTGVRLLEPKAPAQAATFTLTKNGVACLKKGVAFDAVPNTCAGFYDRYEVMLFEDEDDEDYDYNEIIFYAGSEKVARMFAPRFLRDYTVSNAMIFSPKVSTPEGVHPGMLLSKLITLKGLDTDNQGDLILNGYSIGLNYDDLTPYGKKTKQDAYALGKTWKISLNCFKAGAKVQYIGIVF